MMRFLSIVGLLIFLAAAVQAKPVKRENSKQAKQNTKSVVRHPGNRTHNKKDIASKVTINRNLNKKQSRPNNQNNHRQTASGLAVQPGDPQSAEVCLTVHHPAKAVAHHQTSVSGNTGISTEIKKEEPGLGTQMWEWVKDKYSCMMDVVPNQITNVMLYRFIDDWYGVRYRMGGTTKKGVDCSAFVQTLYKYVFGLDLLRTAYMQFNTSQLISNPADLKEGDLVFFRVRSSRISHVGVYLRNNFFVHSASSKGVSIASLSSEYWSRYFVGGGRIMQP